MRLDYAATVIGSEVSLPVTIKNTGGLPLSLSRLYFSGTGEFTQTNNCPAELAAAASCVVDIKPFPGSVSAPPLGKSGFLQIVSNDPVNPQASVTLYVPAVTGTFIPAPVTVNPNLVVTTHNFNNTDMGGLINFSKPFATSIEAPIVIGVTSSRNFINLKNNGTTTIALGPVRVVGPENRWFNVGGAGKVADAGYHAPCGTTLAPATSCDIGVDFLPLALGRADVDVVEVWSADVATKIAEVNVKGISSDKAALDFEPESLSFGSVAIGAQADLTAKIKNIGPQSLDMTVTGMSVVATGTDTLVSDYSVTHDCTVVPALGFCTATIRFKPLTAGLFNAELKVDNDAVNFYKRLPLSGTGAAALSRKR